MEILNQTIGWVFLPLESTLGTYCLSKLLEIVYSNETILNPSTQVKAFHSPLPHPQEIINLMYKQPLISFHSR